MTNELQSVSEVIHALGGTKAAAHICGVGVNAVSNWRVRGAFPAHTFPRISSELLKRGAAAKFGLWSFERKKQPK
mgnify:CR=1 FL=1